MIGHHYPRKESEYHLPLGDVGEIICRMAEDSPEGPEDPSQRDNLDLILTTKEMPEDILDLYRILYAFTDGNTMAGKGGHEVLIDNGKEDESIMFISKQKAFPQPGASDNNPGRKLSFIAKDPSKDGSIVVKMVCRNSDFGHTFVVTPEAIRGFYHAHPIRSRYGAAEVMKTFCKQINEFCCETIDAQPIMRDRARETIHAVYVDTWETDHGPVKRWSFDVETDNGDVINPTYDWEIRYCAFMEAFRKAMCDSTRGGTYEWLYRAICYSAT